MIYVGTKMKGWVDVETAFLYEMMLIQIAITNTCSMRSLKVGYRRYGHGIFGVRFGHDRIWHELPLQTLFK
jgi:hypothetical protein